MRLLEKVIVSKHDKLDNLTPSFGSDSAKRPLIVWRRGFTVLSTGQVLLTKDTRFRVEGERSILSISRVREDDAGEYVCQTTTIGGV